MYSKGIGKDPPSDHDDSWENDSSIYSANSSQYDVSELEAHFYYFGIRGPRRRGPKLIFRTSTDVFTVPLGQEQDIRRMQLQPVYEHHKLGKDDLWATIRSKVRELLKVR